MKYTLRLLWDLERLWQVLIKREHHTDLFTKGTQTAVKFYLLPTTHTLYMPLRNIMSQKVDLLTIVKFSFHQMWNNWSTLGKDLAV